MQPTLASVARRHPASALTAICLGTTLALTGCGDGDADPQPHAEALAEALATGDFSEVAVRSSGGQEELSAAVTNLHEPFGDLRPEISLGDIEVEDPGEDSDLPRTAAVDITHEWELGELGIEEAWSYQTQAEFVFSVETDEWRLEADTETVLPEYSGTEVIGLSAVSAERGRIMDDAGTAMVYDRPVLRLGIDKSELSDGDGAPDEQSQREAAEQLADLVEIDAETYADRVVAHGDQAFVEAIVHRADSDEVTAQEVDEISGAVAHADQMALAESADFAPQLLGRVGPVTAEHLEEDPALQVGDVVGTSGLQSAHESTLRGSPGMRIHKDGETLFSSDPVDGEDVTTSLRPRLQNLAQEVVDGEDVTTTLVALRPSDGGILAAASHDEEQTHYSTATQSTFAPGSSFKMVSSLAMLRDGLSPDSSVSCPSSARVHGQDFGNYDGFPGEFLGSLPFRDAVAASCNTVFVNAWDSVTSADLQEAAMDLGIIEETRVGLPVSMGHVPGDSELNLHAANLFGQGVVETSTLGMATVAASIAAGETVHPYLVAPDAEDDSTEGFSGDLAAEEAEDLRTLMTDTVDFGTLSSMDSVPGSHVYAKTGTAQAGTEDDMIAHTWVIAFQEDIDLAVAIFLHEGFAGGQTNGPLLAEFLTGAQDILG